jgi:hypothetical protein
MEVSQLFHWLANRRHGEDTGESYGAKTLTYISQGANSSKAEGGKRFLKINIPIRVEVEVAVAPPLVVKATMLVVDY